MIRSRVSFALLFVAGGSVWFILSTVLLDEVSPAGFALAVAVAAVLLAVASGLPSREELTEISVPSLAVTAGTGILMLFAAPLLVVSNRLTDAPPGAETLFFITAVWALAIFLVDWRFAKRQPTLMQWGWMLAGVLGTATLLANWERPSSFSPMVRYPYLELGFIAGGLCWAIGSFFHRHSAHAVGKRSTNAVGAVAALVAAILYALIFSGGVTVLPAVALLPTLLACGAGFAVMYLAWTELRTIVDEPRPVGLWFLTPVVITAITFIEQTVFPRGPNPLVLIGVAGGIVLIVFSAASLAFVSPVRLQIASQLRSKGLVQLATGLAVASFVASLATLMLPSMTAIANAALDVGTRYHKVWTYLGWESAGGWVAPLAALLLLAGALAFASVRSSRLALWGAFGAVLTVATYPLLVATPLHTWNRWVPVEVQSEYGTEFASLGFRVIHSPVRIAVLVLIVVSALVLAAVALLGRIESSRRSGSARKA